MAAVSAQRCSQAVAGAVSRLRAKPVKGRNRAICTSLGSRKRRLHSFPGLFRHSPSATSLGKGGRPIRDVRGEFDPAVRAGWKASKPGEKKPRFHELRKTAATRVETVSSPAAAKVFLGHSDEDVTDSYLQPSLADVREAVNRAARSIDGEIPPGTIAFPMRPVTPAVKPPFSEPRNQRKDGLESSCVTR